MKNIYLHQTLAERVAVNTPAQEKLNWQCYVKQLGVQVFKNRDFGN